MSKQYGYRWQQLRKLVLTRDGYSCKIRYKGCTGWAQSVDHIKPVKVGGTDDLENLQAACKYCNLLKGAFFEGGVSADASPAEIYLQQPEMQPLTGDYTRRHSK